MRILHAPMLALMLVSGTQPARAQAGSGDSEVPGARESAPPVSAGDGAGGDENGSQDVGHAGRVGHVGEGGGDAGDAPDAQASHAGSGPDGAGEGPGAGAAADAEQPSAAVDAAAQSSEHDRSGAGIAGDAGVVGDMDDMDDMDNVAQSDGAAGAGAEELVAAPPSPAAADAFAQRSKTYKAELVQATRERDAISYALPWALTAVGGTLLAAGVTVGAIDVATCDGSCQGEFWPGWAALLGGGLFIGGMAWLAAVDGERDAIESRRYHLEDELRQLRWEQEARVPEQAKRAFSTRVRVSF